MKILVFAPHYDDEIVGPGGYIFKQIKDGNSVDVAFMTEIEDHRKTEVKPVLDYVGFEKVYRFDHAKPRLVTKTEDLVKKTLRAIRDSAPTQILVPHSGESDPEHSFLHQLVMECSFVCEQDYLLDNNQKPCSIETILGYEVWTPIARPSLFVDITNTIKKKDKAMKLYHTQDFKNFIQMYKGLNQYRGIQSGKGKFVEAFEIYKAPERLFKEL
jgi:LmbE family N-acetylglucosaminyl deacetylase